MRILIKMELKSDAIFGNGMSMPGGEDICIQTDEKGFPFLKGNTFKGILKEELINYLNWEKKSEAEIRATIKRLFGESGSDLQDSEKLLISDFCIHSKVKKSILEEKIQPSEMMSIFSYTRDFTSLESGLAKDGSLRSARCIKKGYHFYGNICCQEQDKEMIKEVLSMIKWVGTMRNRGFGKVEIKTEDSND